jgi:sugar lactone lactonase YvrE
MGKRLTAFRIRASGSLARQRTWATVDGHPDGICIDSDGNIWYADVPNQECVLVAEGGSVLRTVPSPKGCFDCALAGSDQKSSYSRADGADSIMTTPARKPVASTGAHCFRISS